MINETTIKIALAIIVAVFILGIIRKAVKFAVVFICVLVVGMFSYDFIVLGNNPIDSIKNIKNDTIYIKDISGYTIDIQEDLRNIKNTLISNEKASVKQKEMKKYVDDLKEIRNKIDKLDHSYRLDSLDEAYLKQLDNIIDSSSSMEESSKVLEIIDDFSTSIDEINKEITSK